MIHEELNTMEYNKDFKRKYYINSNSDSEIKEILKIVNKKNCNFQG